MRKLFSLFIMLLIFSVASAEDCDILAIKNRMKELDYYWSDKPFNSICDADMQRRIKRFQSYNDLDITGELDTDTVEKILSEEARTETAYFETFHDANVSEPDISLFIHRESKANATYSDTLMNVNVQVKNVSPTRTVTAYELVFVPYDPWGCPLLEDGQEYAVNTIAEVKPGSVNTSTRIWIDRRNEIFELHAGIRRIRYSDDTIVVIPDDEIVFISWSGPFNK